MNPTARIDSIMASIVNDNGIKKKGKGENTILKSLLHQAYILEHSCLSSTAKYNTHTAYKFKLIKGSAELHTDKQLTLKTI